MTTYKTSADGLTALETLDSMENRTDVGPRDGTPEGGLDSLQMAQSSLPELSTCLHSGPECDHLDSGSTDCRHFTRPSIIIPNRMTKEGRQSPDTGYWILWSCVPDMNWELELELMISFSLFNAFPSCVIFDDTIMILFFLYHSCLLYHLYPCRPFKCTANFILR
ncbi:hypothetical protein VN97_g7310 [Penicillium thymicola]|uniref:Uncharacterized protein n=1 Tax=Penicillium thymicola TaxID=293382 RepID=A0AAI9TGL8_PENTH|nr:hypothetical protein VN97_g7310 [Penicillium thymicola]